MIKVYAMLIVIAMLGGAGYGAYWYYQDTQQRIAILTENNAKMKVAVQVSENSVKTLQAEAAKTARLNRELQGKLQVAEQYGDTLRKRLRQLDLVGDAIKDAENLEGRMNSATANLWRGIEADTGGNGDAPLPKWLQPPAATGSESSNPSPENNDTSSSTTETSATK
jgi:hypothetical protein